MRISDWSSDVCSSDLALKEPASMAFSTSSLSAAAGLSTTSPAAIRFTSFSGRRRIDIEALLAQSDANRDPPAQPDHFVQQRSEEHTSELQSLMRISYAVFCLKKKRQNYIDTNIIHLVLTPTINNHT